MASWLERKIVSEQTSDRISFVVRLTHFVVGYVVRILFAMALPWNVNVGTPRATPAGYNTAAAIQTTPLRAANGNTSGCW